MSSPWSILHTSSEILVSRKQRLLDPSFGDLETCDFDSKFMVWVEEISDPQNVHILPYLRANAYVKPTFSELCFWCLLGDVFVAATLAEHDFSTRFRHAFRHILQNMLHFSMILNVQIGDSAPLWPAPLALQRSTGSYNFPQPRRPHICQHRRLKNVDFAVRKTILCYKIQ